MINTSTFIQFVTANNLCSKNDNILLAVSGGADSMVMCDLFLQSGFTFGIAHCNFQLRNEASDADEQLVFNYTQKNNIPFYAQRFDTITYSKLKKLSIEEAARDLRYAYFAVLCSEHGYNLVATAHHANDNAETILMRLAKGTGIKGLQGIPVKNNQIIRPLLFATKNDINEYCITHQIAYRDDESNFSDNILRNYFRLNIIPQLEKVNPSFIPTMRENVLHIEGAFQFYEQAVAKRMHKIVRQKGNDKYISIAALGDALSAGVLLHELLSPIGFNATQIKQIIATFGQTGKQFFSEKYRVIIDRKHIIITAKTETPNSIQFIEAGIKKIDAGNFSLQLDTTAFNKSTTFNSDNHIAYFDADKITYPLTIRRWKAGDYLYPLGLTKRKSDKPGKKKVSDILTNAKADTLAKENTFVILSGEKIIWLIGFRQDERFKTTNSTRNLLKIKMLPK